MLTFHGSLESFKTDGFRVLEKNMDYMDLCPECGGRDLSRDYKRAEIVCGGCGLVVDEDIVDQGPEWRAFDYGQMQARSRTGAPMTYLVHDKGLSTTIDQRDRDIFGNNITKHRAQLYRIRKWQKRIRVSNSIERNLSVALMELERFSSRLALPRNVRETSAVVYRKAVGKGLVRGRGIERVLAASLYIACRQCNVPRTLDEISEASGVGRKDIGKTYRFISRQMGIGLNPTTPVDYVPRFGSELGLSGEVQSKAIEILRAAMDMELTSGRGPVGACAAAIYIASVLLGERRTQKEIADAAAVTEVTIRNRYKEMAEKLDIEVAL